MTSAAALDPHHARVRASIEAYVAAWNERDGATRMKLLEQCCAEDFRLCTPGKRVNGRVELDALIVDFQRRRPGARAVFSSAIDVQGNVFRYAGRVEGAPGGDVLDTGECTDDGRIRVLLTFVGANLPSLT
jgi:hypothetical protein